MPGAGQLTSIGRGKTGEVFGLVISFDRPTLPPIFRTKNEAEKIFQLSAFQDLTSPQAGAFRAAKSPKPWRKAPPNLNGA
jgi:hypothetical protein